VVGPAHVSLRWSNRSPTASPSAFSHNSHYWSFPWASSYGSDFNFDFRVAHTKQEWEAGVLRYNFGEQHLRSSDGQSRYSADGQVTAGIGYRGQQGQRGSKIRSMREDVCLASVGQIRHGLERLAQSGGLAKRRADNEVETTPRSHLHGKLSGLASAPVRRPHVMSPSTGHDADV
jgi:hypothetical protein